MSHCDVKLSERERREEERRQRQRDQSYTVQEWCAARRISLAMFYKMKALGIGPKTHNAGRRRLISPAADAEWLREREAESNA